VLPLSAGHLTKAFPDLWASVKEADNALAAVRNYLKLQIEFLFGESRQFSVRLY